MSKIPLTLRGAEQLREELHRLKTVERPSVIAAIAEARSHGDLSENAEYDAAKERHRGGEQPAIFGLQLRIHVATPEQQRGNQPNGNR